MKTVQLKKIPSFKTDHDAEEFVDSADLSEYDLSGFKPMYFEIAKKSASLNMRIPEHCLMRSSKRPSVKASLIRRMSGC